MTNQAVIQGDFVDLKFVKGRKVCQLVIETPIEHGKLIVDAFGTPLPHANVPVAVARLNPDAVDEPAKPEDTSAEEAPRRQMGDLGLAQQAGILCNDRRFQVFLNEQYRYQAESADDAAEAVRELCKIKSRSELNSNDEAANQWLDLRAEFDGWKMAA